MAESVRSASGTTPGQDPNVSYALGSSPGESARLQSQADELAPDSRDLLDRVGLRPGRAVIDLGCGPRGILDLLAERVAPAGRVVGLDADPAHTAMAAEFAAGRGLRGVEIMTADARSTGLAAGSFDLVHARTLLVNLPDPADVAAEMVRLARPGGWVASMEPDTEHGRCYPPYPAFDRLCDIFTVAFRRNGADPWIGRRVPELFRQAGLDDVQVEARVQMYPPGNSRRTVRLDLVRAMRPQVLEMGLASAAELDELDTAARAHLRDPHTVVISGLLFLTWGRKPDHMQHDLLPTRKYRCNINCYGQDPAQEFAGYADRVRRRSHGTVCASCESISPVACVPRPSRCTLQPASPQPCEAKAGQRSAGGGRTRRRTKSCCRAGREDSHGGDGGQ